MKKKSVLDIVRDLRNQGEQKASVVSDMIMDLLDNGTRGREAIAVEVEDMGGWGAYAAGELRRAAAVHIAPKAKAEAHTPGRLYYHKTDGGAEYLCAKPVEGTTEGDLRFAAVRLDGEPELLGVYPAARELRGPVPLSPKDKGAGHTPGPWIVEGDGHDAWIMQGGGNQIGIAAVYDVNGVEEQNANAALMAAAPELLESLELTLSALEEYMGKDGREENEVFLKARKAAIAKAKGQ